MAERAVAEELQHRKCADQVQKNVGYSDVEELWPLGKKAKQRQQQDCPGADRICRQQSVKDRWSIKRPDNSQYQGD